MNRLRKGMAALLCALLLVGLLPTAAMAAVGIDDGIPAATMFTKNVTTVSFAGHEWYVIDTGADNVTNPGANHITLLAKNADFGPSAFREGNNTQDDASWTLYPGDSWYYAGNFSQPSDYDDSTLMNTLATATDALPDNEVYHITARDFGANADGISGAAVNGQNLWPLSLAEYQNMGTLSGDAFSGNFWLRSPSFDSNADVGIPGGGTGRSDFVDYPPNAVRPALNLDLTSVLFTSDASGASAKSSATVGSGLIGASAPTQNLKFTFSDSSAAPTVTFAGTTDGTSTLRFGYSGAAIGTNQYLSCVLEQSGTVTHYGKLADCNTETSGVFSIDTSSLAADTYTLKVFSEQANGELYSDFASAVTNFTLTVDGSGNGTVTGGASDNAAPTVSTVAPSGATEPVSGNVVITFSEAMNPAAGVGEVKLNTGAALTGGAWSSGNTVYTAPYSGLAASTAYTVNISGFQDAAGNEMTPDSAHQFTTAAVPVVTTNPMSLDFGYIAPGSSSAAKTITVSGANLTGNISHSLSGAGAAAFTVTEDTGWSNATGGTLSVTFNPTAAQAYSATLTIQSPGATDVTVSLSGTGVQQTNPNPNPNPSNPDPDPNPAPTYSQRILVDSTTGVTVSGLMTADATLSVTPNALHPQGTCAACDEIRTTASARGGFITLHDITIATGSYSGHLTVTMPVNDTYNAKTLDILHCKSNHVETLTAKAQNGAVTFVVSSLSPFAVVAQAGGANNNPSTGGYPDHGVPQTGDNANIGLWVTMLALSLSLAGFAVVQLIRRRRASFGRR